MDYLNASLQKINVGRYTLELFVPDAVSVRRYHELYPSEFPFWTQIWPAAMGLCIFLEKHTELIKNKTVVELAAGLGLPSLLASIEAKSVSMSDYLPDAVQLMQRNIDYNKIENLHCSLINWNKLPDGVKADVLMLSDVNYAPDSFDSIFNVIDRFLHDCSLIILSTPQRLMAKPFIERLAPFVALQEDIIVDTKGIATPVTVFLLKLAS